MMTAIQLSTLYLSAPEKTTPELDTKFLNKRRIYWLAFVGTLFLYTGTIAYLVGASSFLANTLPFLQLGFAFWFVGSAFYIIGGSLYLAYLTMPTE